MAAQAKRWTEHDDSRGQLDQHLEAVLTEMEREMEWVRNEATIVEQSASSEEEEANYS